MASRTVLLAVALVIGLLVGFGATYVYSQNQITTLQSNLAQANESLAMLHREQANTTRTLPLTLTPGANIRNGWVLIVPVGSGHYAIAVHAEGLKLPSAGGYIVEGVQRNGTMLPIGENATASEFDAGPDGVGNLWALRMENPSTTFTSIQLLYLPGMQMTRATPVASVSLG